MNTHRVFPCPRCGKKLRVPVLLKKRLMVTCPSCSYETQVRFDHPMAQLFEKLRRRWPVALLAFVLGLIGVVLLLGQLNQQNVKQKLPAESEEETIQVL